MIEYTIHLYRSPKCDSGWIECVGPPYIQNATFTVIVEAETGADAIEKAVASVDNDFKDVVVIARNYNHEIWGIDNFPELDGK